MQGIPFFHFKCLRADLDKILEQSEFLELSNEHKNSILEYKEVLNNVYVNYEAQVKVISSIIQEYKDHQIAIRRLIIQHKKYKQLMKKQRAGWNQEELLAKLKIAK